MSGLFEKLNRRGVIRIVVAYLAIGWLVLQVIDVVGGIFELPPWLPPFAFYALLTGFPIAVVLTWIYDITPQGIVVAGDSESTKPPTRFGGRKIDLIIISSLALVIALLGGRLLLEPDQSEVQHGPPLVSDYLQLTRSRIFFPPTPSPIPIVSDGSRLYFNDWNNGELGLRQLSQSGGEAQRMESPLEDGILINPQTMTPDGANLVVSAFKPMARKLPEVWHFPVMGGDARHIGQGTDVSYSTDGANIVFAQGMADLAIANADLTESRTLATLQGRIHWPRFSPDNRAIRYTLQAEIRAIWEIGVDGGEPQPLFPEWEFVDHCCGSWTQDGKFYVFQATVDYRTQIWALKNEATKPAFENARQITTGALEFRRPTIGPDGKQIFVVGWQLRGELVHYDSALDRFVPLEGFDSVSAEWLAFSSDQDLVAYVSFPEGELWRSGKDGSRKLQLTFPPMRAADPVWSPDKRSIAFSGQMPGEPWRIYIVSAGGNAPMTIGDTVRPQGLPNWSPDGALLAFNESGSNSVKILDIATGNVTDLPESEGLFMPRWTPDGNSIVALTRNEFVLYDIETGQSVVIAEKFPVEMFEVSKDGRYLYVVNPFMLGPNAAVHRVTIADGIVQKIAGINNVRIPWGVQGIWVGITPDGDPMMLRDLSIHHIYALDWLADESMD